MRVAADDHVDDFVELLHDLHHRAADACAVVVVAAVQAAFVHQHDDGRYALAFQLGHQRIDALRFVAKAQPGHARRHHHRRREACRQANKGHRHAFEALDPIGRKEGLSSGFDLGVGRQVLKACTFERRRPLAALVGVTAALLQTQQLGLAAVELVVAHGRDFQAHQVQRFDRRLVVQHRRQQRRGTDEVTRGDEHRVRVLCALLRHQCGHLLGATCRQARARLHHRQAVGGRLEVAVKVVDGQDAHLQRRARGWCRAAPQRGRERPGQQAR